MDFKNIIVFTDGACSGNPGPGGWGAISVTPNGEVKELGGGDKQTTNNKMELMATIQILEFYKNNSLDIDLYTDSVYVIKGITQWIWGWRKKGWINSQGEEVANRALWERLGRVVGARKSKINWLYCRGHQGTPGNERCDEIAVAYSKNIRMNLYTGSLLNYDIAIHDLPTDTAVPEAKKSGTSKAKAYSYLSLVNGVLTRHKSWPECERQVKGRSGAKFKKAMSPSDEKKIFSAWGVDGKAIVE